MLSLPIASALVLATIAKIAGAKPGDDAVGHGQKVAQIGRAVMERLFSSDKSQNLRGLN